MAPCGPAPPRPGVDARTAAICGQDAGEWTVSDSDVARRLSAAIASVCSIPQDLDAGCATTGCTCTAATMETGCFQSGGGWIWAPCDQAVELQLEAIYDAGACGDAIWRLCYVGDGCVPVTPMGC